MRLSDLNAASLSTFSEYELEDRKFFWDMVIRFIEDVDLIAYTLMRERGKSEITQSIMGDAVKLMNAGEAVLDGDRFLSFAFVKDYARAPVTHEEKALVIMGDFLSGEVVRVLRGAAERAKADGLQTVKVRHILPGCESWPWPLSRYC